MRDLLVTVAWKKLCRPSSQGGLNLRSLCSLNNATNLKLCWDLLNSDKAWAKLLKDRVLKHGKVIQYHIYSSLWSSIKEEYNVIQENSIWLMGKGDKINFWNDSWCGQPLAYLFNIPDHVTSLLTSSVSDYIHNGHWNIHVGLQLKFPNLTHMVHQITIPIEEQCDSIQWKYSQVGDLQLKEAYSFKHQ